MRSSLIFLLLTVILAGCATPPPQPTQTSEPSPEPAPLQATIPTRWKNPSPADVSAPTPWWKALNDPVLDDLVAQALSANPDIAFAEARLAQIRSAVAAADADEQAAASAEQAAAENDLRVALHSVPHAVVLAYADARLAKQRVEALHRRMLLTRELTSREYKLLAAGLANTARLREDDQTEIEIRQAKVGARSEYDQACARLALLLGMAPVEFTLLPAGDIFAAHPLLAAEAPNAVIERRPDVQAAWQRLLSATAAKDQGDGDLPLSARIDQAGNGKSERDALYRKTVLAALQEVESALSTWRSSGIELHAAEASLQTRSAEVHAIQRQVAAGHASRIELLKAQLAENLAQEQVLAAKHARLTAYAAAQLALARN